MTYPAPASIGYSLNAGLKACPEPAEGAGSTRTTPTLKLPLRIALCHEVADFLVGGFQHVLRRQKNDPHVPCSRLLAEARAMHYQHMLLLRQSGYKRQVVLRNIERGVGVKGA